MASLEDPHRVLASAGLPMEDSVALITKCGIDMVKSKKLKAMHAMFSTEYKGMAMPQVSLGAEIKI